MKHFKDYLTEWNSGISRGSPRKFSKAIKYTEGAISDWIHGKEIPGETIRETIISELNKKLDKKITIEQLMACFPPRKHLNAPASLSLDDRLPLFVPVIGTVTGEYFKCNFDDGYYPLEVLKIMATKGQRVRALKVEGDCLKPEANNKDILLVALDAPYEEGSLVVVKVNDEYTIKTIYTHKDKVTLKLDGYNDIVMNKKNIQVIGAIPYVIVKKEPKL